MKKPNVEIIEKEEELRFNKKLKRKKISIRVSGANVKKIAKIIAAKEP